MPSVGGIANRLRRLYAVLGNEGPEVTTFVEGLLQSFLMSRKITTLSFALNGFSLNTSQCQDFYLFVLESLRNEYSNRPKLLGIVVGFSAAFSDVDPPISPSRREVDTMSDRMSNITVTSPVPGPSSWADQVDLAEKEEESELRSYSSVASQPERKRAKVETVVVDKYQATARLRKLVSSFKGYKLCTRTRSACELCRRAFRVIKPTRCEEAHPGVVIPEHKGLCHIGHENIWRILRLVSHVIPIYSIPMSGIILLRKTSLLKQRRKLAEKTVFWYVRFGSFRC